MASSVQPGHGRARRSCASCHGQPYPLCMAMLWSGTSFRRGRGTVDRASPAQSRHGRASLDLAKSHHNCETTPGHRAASTQPYYGPSRHCRMRLPHAATGHAMLNRTTLRARPRPIMLVQRSKAMVETRIYVQPCDGRLLLYQRSRVASSRKSWASTRHWHAARPRSIVPLWCSQARVDHTSPGAATLWSYTSLLGNHAMVPRALFNTPILGSIPHPSGKPAKASAPPLRSHAMACRASRPSHRFLDSHAMAGRASLVQPCQGLLHLFCTATPWSNSASSVQPCDGRRPLYRRSSAA